MSKIKKWVCWKCKKKTKIKESERIDNKYYPNNKKVVWKVKECLNCGFSCEVLKDE